MNERSTISFSVIIPLYNAETTIMKTLDSVKHQTYFKYIQEIIIVNDGSTDGSMAVVERYKQYNTEMPLVVINKENGGVSSARNVGLNIAKGSWIALLDSDDCWFTDKLEIQVELIVENSEIDFLGGDINPFGLNILGKKIRTLYKANIHDLCLKVFPQTSTAVFRRSICEEIGGYDESQNHGEDVNYFMKICNAYNYYHMPRQMVSYGSNKRGFGVSGLSANLKKMHEGSIKNIKELQKKGIIGFDFYMVLRLFYFCKYIRRQIITKFL